MSASVTPTAPKPSGFAASLDRFFEITKRKSSFGRESRGGLTTFFMMAYIVVLNPFILGFSLDKNGHVLGGGTAAHLTAIAGVTALVAAVMTLIMGVVGRAPFGIAIGLGLNSFLAVQVAPKMSWPDAMGLVVIEGLVIMVFVATGFRQAVFRAVPPELKAAIAAGIGMFIALIGLVDGGIVTRVPDAAHTTVPVQLGSGNGLSGWPVLVFFIGLIVSAVLMLRRVKGALLISILGTTIIAMIIEAVAGGTRTVDGQSQNILPWSLNAPRFPSDWFKAPDLSLVGNVSFGGFHAAGIFTALLLTFSLILSDFFDVMGTTVALGHQANLIDEKGDLPRLGPILMVDGAAAVIGGAASASSATTYVESSGGIADGARTGFANIVTGLMFLVALLFTPLVQVVPSEAAAPALVVVGVMMAAQLKRIDFGNLEVAIPAFLTVAFMPFTYSIADGLGMGFISYVVIKLARGKAREVHPIMWIVAAAFLVFFCITPIKHLFGLN